MRPWLLCVPVLSWAACGPEMFMHDPPDAAAETPDAAPPPPMMYPDAPECDESVPVMVVEVKTPPDVLLVVDKSGSMRDRLNSYSSQSKWQIMRTALNSIVQANDQDIYYGLMLFPSNATCGAGNVSVDIGPSTSSQIVSQLNAVTYPDGSTPTHTSLVAAANYYTARPVQNPNGRFVLLATDGVPNCGPGGQNDRTDEESVAAVNTLMGLGIKTYVIGFGSGSQVDPGTLQNMAVAGQTSPYYQVDSADALQAALEAISSEVILPACEYTLQEVPENPMRITVNFDGVAVARTSSHTNGWDYSTATNSITLYGTACAQVQSGSVMNVGVDYGCIGPSLD